jgi:hypothetical protein
LFVTQSEPQARLELKGVFATQRTKLESLLEAIKQIKGHELDGHDAVMKTH